MARPPTQATRLAPGEIAEVLTLAAAAGDTDGGYPLSEHAVLHLRHGEREERSAAEPRSASGRRYGERAAGVVHLLARDDDGALAGYLQVDTTDEVDGGAAELVVHPLRRGRGLGRALVTAALAVAEAADPVGRLRLWAHGDHPAAGALALALGFERARVLWQMRRPLVTPVPEPALPAGVRLRPFRPGADDEAWLAVNARAFAHHPDQSRWTRQDLRLRMAEPWFDPAGFLLAVRDQGDELLGFHWTKVHASVPPRHEPMGEVYVLGVGPAAQGLGLGAALTAAGLRHLRARGLDQAMLYVDEANAPAVALYTRLGFARWSADVSYRRRPQPR